MSTAHPRPLVVRRDEPMTTRIKDEETPHVMMRLAQRLLDREYMLLMSTMEENKESEIYTVTITYKKRPAMGERQC